MYNFILVMCINLLFVSIVYIKNNFIIIYKYVYEYIYVYVNE